MMPSKHDCSTKVAHPIPRWRRVVCPFIFLASWYAIAGPVVEPGKWAVNLEKDKGIITPLFEAHAWLDGRLDLPDQGDDPRHTRRFDTAYVEKTDRVYNFYPPLMTIIYAAFLVLERHIFALPGDCAGPWLLFTVLALPLILLSYWAFVGLTRSPEWGGLLAIVFLCATANLPLMLWSQNAYPGYAAHLLSQAGVLLIVGDALGRRRFWPAAIGIPITAWSRQLTTIYAIPLLLLAWRRGERRDLAIVAASVGVTIGVQMGLNWAKFGSPLESGYRLIYEGRDDDLARRAKLGLFSTRWIPDNLWYMVGAVPRPNFSHLGLQMDTSVIGNSLFITTPISVAAWAAVWYLRRDGWRVLFLASTVPVVGAILLYHAPGIISTGCYRFGTDFLAVWLLAAAPALVRPKWRWWTMGCAAFGLVYFQMATRGEGI